VIENTLGVLHNTSNKSEHTPRGIIHFRSYDVTSCDVTSNPVAILLPVMHNDTFYTNTIVRKKRGENDVISGHVTSVHVTSISHATSGHAQLYISYYCYGKKKARECPSEHVQNILPVMTSLPVRWLHVTSFLVKAASGDVTSSNAYAMTRSPLLPPKYSLTCSDTLLWYLDLGGPNRKPMKKYRKTA
jgi:hypothetical protein